MLDKLINRSCFYKLTLLKSLLNVLNELFVFNQPYWTKMTVERNQYPCCGRVKVLFYCQDIFAI